MARKPAEVWHDNGSGATAHGIDFQPPLHNLSDPAYLADSIAHQIHVTPAVKLPYPDNGSDGE